VAKASIIAIGDELLIGKTQDTNSSYLAAELDGAGYIVSEIRVVSDNEGIIRETLDAAQKRSDIVLITGGLGPTRDDLTRDVLNEYFGGTLVLNEQVLLDIKERFAYWGREITPTNEDQAMVPDVCKPLHNANGTAPGMWFDQDSKVIVSMPGVPGEMRAMFKNQVLPRLLDRFKVANVHHRHVLTIGIPESNLSDQLSDFEDALPEHIKLAYLPTFQIVKLRLTGTGEEQAVTKELNDLVDDLSARLKDNIWGYDNDSQEGVIGILCKDAAITLGTAESCTAGFIGHTITKVPGSSDYYKGSVVSYANAIKADLLNVAQGTLDQHGAVSEEVALEMVKGAQQVLDVDAAISVTGIAGPDGGTDEKPVGTVWIAVAFREQVLAKQHRFGKDRAINIQRTTMAALEMLRRMILQSNS
jgi:nicotinamide-nucleotide amidase